MIADQEPRTTGSRNWIGHVLDAGPSFVACWGVGVDFSTRRKSGEAFSQPFSEAINRFDELVQLAIYLAELRG